MKYSFKGNLKSGIYEVKLSFITKYNNDGMLDNWGSPGYELSDEKVLVRIDAKEPNYVTLYGTNVRIPIVWFYEEDVPYIDDIDMAKSKEHSYTYFSKIMDKRNKEPYYLALVLIKRVRYDNLRKVRNDVYYQDGNIPKNLLELSPEDLNAKIGEYLDMLKNHGGIDRYIGILMTMLGIAAKKYNDKTNPEQEAEMRRKENYDRNYSDYYDADLANLVNVLKKDQ